MPMFINRRNFVQGASASMAIASLSSRLSAAESAAHSFAPRPGDWRTFDVVTTIAPKELSGLTTVWVPVPSVSSPWQRTLDTSIGGSTAKSKQVKLQDETQCVVAEFVPGAADATLQITSRVQTQSRAFDRAKHSARSDEHAGLERWVRPTASKPTDGVVRKVALQITDGAHGDLAKVQRIYEWVVVNTYREPKVRGCGLGDIKVMLETGNLGGKCADINGLFVGLCRAAGLPARDLYGLRVAPSAFGYREIGGKSESLQGAQHCRSEVYVQGHGWLAMDPADVDKVMRQETSAWIKDADDPLIAPLRKGLFGGWEGNWMAYNCAEDVTLPGSAGATLPFFMYPQAENFKGRYDSLDASAFSYTIAAHEVTA
jgi:transglutaminase-like putative cysteine protease